MSLRPSLDVIASLGALPSFAELRYVLWLALRSTPEDEDSGLELAFLSGDTLQMLLSHENRLRFVPFDRRLHSLWLLPIPAMPEDRRNSRARVEACRHLWPWPERSRFRGKVCKLSVCPIGDCCVETGLYGVMVSRKGGSWGC